MSLNTDTIAVTSKVDFALGTPVSSSATTDINEVTGNTIRITGTTNITAFATASQAGIVRTLIFNDAVLLTNSANLILFGSANITTVAEDVFVFIAETTTQWRMIGFHRSSGVTDGKLNANSIANGAITSTKLGDGCVINSKIPTKTVVALTDAAQNLTPENIINSAILTCTPTTARVKTLPTASAIIALLTGYQVGTSFEFTVLSLASFDVTIASNTGITLVGDTIANNRSATYIGVVTGASTITIYRK